MLRSSVFPAVAMLVISAVMASADVDAQGVMLAARVIGKVVQMSQTSKDGASTFDTAAVIVNVPVEKVYATVKRSVENAQSTQGVIITREDDAQHFLEFSRDDQTAAIQVVALGDKLTHMMVSSARPAAKPAGGGLIGAIEEKSAQKKPAPTTLIVERILSVCAAMNVVCSSAGQ
jgi:hypothetical protein